MDQSRRGNLPLLLIAAAALTGGRACDCGGPFVDGSCVDSSDCEAPGAYCLDGRCIEPDAGEETGPGGDGDAEPDSDSRDEPCPGLVCGEACCREGEVCLGSGCCAAESACGRRCCGEHEVCEDGACRLDCGAALPCGDACCAGDEVCHAGGCTVPGEPCDDPYDCPPESYCEPTIGRCMPRAGIDESCEYRPAPGEFEPAVEWQWSGSPVEPAHDQVMMQPIVVQLTDDNGDGLVDERDVPDIVFHSFAPATGYQRNGVMRAVSGDGSGEIWSVLEPAHRTRPDSSIAAGDIDGDGLVEIVTCTGIDTEGVIAFEHDGTFKWLRTGGPRCRASAPALADLDHDGNVEVVVGRGVLRGEDGSVLWHDAGHPMDVVTGEDAGGDFSVVVNLDGLPGMEIVAGTTFYHHDGAVLWEGGLPTGYAAVGDLDGDGLPEVVVVQSRGSGVGTSWETRPHQIRAFRADGSELWGPFDINQGRPTPDGPAGGGPPTIADFDGDGRPEVAAAGGYGYVIFDGEDGTPVWFVDTVDRSSRCTGSSVFDFEGDGAAEAVYADEHHLRIYRGADGFELFTMCNMSATHWEYPVIVDVDQDDHAEIVVARNNYAAWAFCEDGTRAPTGIAVIGDASNNWVRTRRIWNQHTYHVTNVEEDGRIPTFERDNWLVAGLNNFRQNVQPEGLFAAPDLVVARLVVDDTPCPESLLLAAWVTNRGAGGAPAGIPVAFYEGDPEAGGLLLGVVATPAPILPGASVRLALSVPVGAGRAEETLLFWVRLDDDGTGARSGVVHECRPDNNTFGPTPGLCRSIG